MNKPEYMTRSSNAKGGERANNMKKTIIDVILRGRSHQKPKHPQKDNDSANYFHNEIVSQLTISCQALWN